jgi:hypothetical protein
VIRCLGGAAFTPPYTNAISPGRCSVIAYLAERNLAPAAAECWIVAIGIVAIGIVRSVAGQMTEALAGVLSLSALGGGAARPTG